MPYYYYIIVPLSAVLPTHTLNNITNEIINIDEAITNILSLSIYSRS